MRAGSGDRPPIVCGVAFVLAVSNVIRNGGARDRGSKMTPLVVLRSPSSHRVTRSVSAGVTLAAASQQRASTYPLTPSLVGKGDRTAIESGCCRSRAMSKGWRALRGVQRRETKRAGGCRSPALDAHQRSPASSSLRLAEVSTQIGPAPSYVTVLELGYIRQGFAVRCCACRSENAPTRSTRCAMAWSSIPDDRRASTLAVG